MEVQNSCKYAQKRGEVDVSPANVEWKLGDDQCPFGSWRREVMRWRRQWNTGYGDVRGRKFTSPKLELATNTLEPGKQFKVSVCSSFSHYDMLLMIASCFDTPFISPSNYLLPSSK